MKIKYLHTMVRVKDIDASKRFYCDLLGLTEVRRMENEAGKFTLVFLAPPGQEEAQVELTYNWDSDETYDGGRNFGHLAYSVEDIYAMCEKLQSAGVTINRPPRDGRMAFVRSPDGISVELLQMGDAKEPQEQLQRDSLNSLFDVLLEWETRLAQHDLSDLRCDDEHIRQ